MITEKQIVALNEVAYRAVLHARVLANGAQYRLRARVNRKWAEQIADLMDAIHNIPNHLRDLENADLEFLLSCLDGCDSKWKDEDGFPRLRTIYNETVGS